MTDWFTKGRLTVPHRRWHDEHCRSWRLGHAYRALIGCKTGNKEQHCLDRFILRGLLLAVIFGGMVFELRRCMSTYGKDAL
jgi:hypothetical protein